MCREGEAEALAEGVSSGVLDIVSSHHAAYNSQQRALGKDSFVNIPKGVTGVEERMVSADLHQIFFMFCQIFFSSLNYISAGCVVAEVREVGGHVPAEVRGGHLGRRGQDPQHLPAEGQVSSHWSRPRPVLTCDWCSVTVGADADLVIWDAKQSKTISSEEHLSKCDVNIFQDLACTGGPEFVIFKGRMVLGTCKYFLANYSNIFQRQIFFQTRARSGP